MSKRPFRRVPVKGGQPPPDIETLFKELKNRSPNIKSLFAHQADIIREYSRSYLNSRNVSLELPTGSGKTLVGLLISEFRRRVREERVLYLCPTKQLAYQVGRHSEEYGIDSRVLVGHKRDYDRQDLTAYRSAKAIAITTYSGLFNVSPGINDPQLVILDDAHSAETYIASMWSVEIDRDRSDEIYHRILEIFVEDLPSDFVRDVVQEARPLTGVKVEKIPSRLFLSKVGRLKALLDKHIPNPESDLYFPWSVVRKGLHACHLYVSWDQILIRPYIPPTLTHIPFEKANQRIYMSATLGSGGELERITGVGKIDRIPIPATYASYGVGRRLFLFPDFVKDPSRYESWIASKLANTSRTLALCPTNFQGDILRKIISLHPSDIHVLGAPDVESSMDAFVKSNHAVLLLANRYDGIDLPQEDCRQLLVYGLPSRTNLQEAFLEDRLGLDVLLRERIKTRIAQATGRCTRSDTDYATVIMAGWPLLDFCTKTENQDIFHPELRAEIRFSLEQEPHELADLDAMYSSFLAQDEKWEEAEQNIGEMRAAERAPDTTITSALAKGVQHEVEFSYALWQMDYPRAVREGRGVLDSLSGPRAVAPYAALWCYYLAAAAAEAAKLDGAYKKLEQEFLNRARDACKTISWFSDAVRPTKGVLVEKQDPTRLQALSIEGMEAQLKQLGSVGPKFQEKMDSVAQLMNSNVSKKFDQGIAELGRLLGFESWQPEGAATPDCVWQLGDSLAFLIEGKVEESPTDGISVAECRQAGGHLDWAKGQDGLKSADSFSILVTPRETMDQEALPHVDAVHLWSTSDARKLFDCVRDMLADVRTMMVTDHADELRSLILERSIQNDLSPESVKDDLLKRPLKGIPLQPKRAADAKKSTKS